MAVGTAPVHRSGCGSPRRTVVSVSEDGSEVVVRVDDNTRLKFRRDAIREVIRKDESADDESYTEFKPDRRTRTEC